MFYVYILFSEKYNRYYIGSTADVQKRLFEHNHPKSNSYTAKFGPWVLKLCLPISDNRSDALRIEKFIKKQKSRKFNEKLILNAHDENFTNSLILNILSKT